MFPRRYPETSSGRPRCTGRGGVPADWVWSAPSEPGHLGRGHRRAAFHVCGRMGVRATGWTRSRAPFAGRSLFRVSSTPPAASALALVNSGVVDSVQVIYNIFARARDELFRVEAKSRCHCQVPLTRGFDRNIKRRPVPKVMAQHYFGATKGSRNALAITERPRCTSQASQ